MGYFALAAQMRLFENLDQRIRRRLRMCIWKRSRSLRTQVQNLLALGVPRRQAFRHAKSRKGPGAIRPPTRFAATPWQPIEALDSKRPPKATQREAG